MGGKRTLWVRGGAPLKDLINPDTNGTDEQG